MRRHLLALAALLCLLGAGGLFLFEANYFFSSSLFKVSLIFGTMWLAYPQLVKLGSRFSPATVIVFILGVGAIVIWPRLAFFIVPALLVLGGIYLLGWLMQPQQKKK